MNRLRNIGSTCEEQFVFMKGKSTTVQMLYSRYDICKGDVERESKTCTVCS